MSNPVVTCQKCRRKTDKWVWSIKFGDPMILCYRCAGIKIRK